MSGVAELSVSKGAEAALLTACHEPRVDAVIALSPTSLTWCNVGSGQDGASYPHRSSWTWQGRPLPFVPLDDTWTPPELDSAPHAIRGWYERSMRTFAHRLPHARIPVEQARARVLLVAGGDDQMWPSLPFAQELVAQRRAAHAPVRLVARDDAGHRPRLPGEGLAPASAEFRYGGTAEADARLGATAWPHVLELLTGHR